MVGLFAAAIFAVAFWPKPGDKFEFLRKFRPAEERLEPVSEFMPGEGWVRTFTFREITPELCAALELPPKYAEAESPLDAFIFVNGRMVGFNSRDRKLTYFGEPEPSWLDRQWMFLMRKLRG